MTNLIRLENIQKRFKEHQALKNITLELPEGQILGLLGPNGCGKSTLFRILLGLLKPDAGTTEVMGLKNPDEYRRLMGVALDEGNFDPHMTGMGNLKTTAAIKGLTEKDFMPYAEALDMVPALRKRVGNYSFGMKKRLSLIGAMMGNPRLLLLDEPGNGLDVPGNLQLRKLLKDLNQQGTTILLSSHLLSDVEKLCTYLVLMRNGEIIESGETSKIIGSHLNLEESFIQKVM
ncbi:MAG: ABC transporter ATP-binding protein [Hymenobacteraceae bacterium]|nr:ABC transporter ATP-binding protein [Hymenobacteraceae bacterium]MDX5395559.1 ABC transporter ATP-binding protein [Hymenobacteraceae bacterium]MDX5443985.1 ABC transporter ATP-binding protein [Hymenobacteraceae bacterium]MDX5511613.1 ABC transporter ATP-binding protein [Hymenobacteraceae bacterium]